MRGLIFDPFAGISGDMILGGLMDLGLEPSWLQDFVDSLGLGQVQVAVAGVVRRGIACPHVRFELPHEHAHRHLSGILEIVERCGAPGPVKERAAAIFRRLAAAEAAVHGVAVEKIHFHEVGALDAILDVLCAVAGLEALGIQQCYTRPVAVGSGWIRIEHGRYPLPAPATAKLLSGLPVRDTGFEGECTTPTGAAILAVLTEGRPPPAEFTLRQSGHGAGTRDPEDRPNCLRLLLCDVAQARTDALFVIQADIDDLPPEYIPAAQDALFRAGARDAVISSLAMKKGRPGIRVEALVDEAAREAVLDALFRATSTIGARFWPVERRSLPRSEDVVEWKGQRVRVKRVRLPDGTERTKPEYEDVVLAAERLGTTPLEVRRAFDTANLTETRDQT